MAYELDIHFEGTAPGIDRHRLSVSAFGQPLNALLGALRRIATQMVSSAVEGETPTTGRFADPARNLDIEIVEINGNSLGLHTIVYFHEPPIPQQNLPFWANLPERAGKELLDAIERESNGQLSNVAVRKYLACLPPGITRQTYDLHSNGTAIRTLEVKNVQLTTVPAELPFLRKVEGCIVGVGFEPAKNEVKVKPDEGVVLNISANSDSVEKALDMRHDKVRTLTIHTPSGTRLISLKRAADPVTQFDPERAKKMIFERWDNVLRVLSK